MPNRIPAFCAAAAIVFASPALASAQGVAYSVAPVAVTSCNVDQSYQPGPNVDAEPQFVPSAIALKFMNKREVPATAVTFLVNDGQSTQTVVDKGTFSPGIPILHNFAVVGDLGVFSAATCDVTKVDFSDGSSWQKSHGDVAKR